MRGCKQDGGVLHLYHSWGCPRGWGTSWQKTTCGQQLRWTREDMLREKRKIARSPGPCFSPSVISVPFGKFFFIVAKIWSQLSWVFFHSVRKLTGKLTRKIIHDDEVWIFDTGALFGTFDLLSKRECVWFGYVSTVSMNMLNHTRVEHLNRQQRPYNLNSFQNSSHRSS